MRTLAAAALFATALVAVPASQTAQNPRLSDSLERPFPANGQIRMDLSAGEYHVSGTNENRVRLQWRVRDPEDSWLVLRELPPAAPLSQPGNRGRKLVVTRTSPAYTNHKSRCGPRPMCVAGRSRS